MILDISSKIEFDEILNETVKNVAVLFYGNFSEISLKTSETFKEVFEEIGEEIIALTVNVGVVKDIHKNFNVSSVPTIIVFNGKKETERMIGDQNLKTLRNLILGIKNSKNEGVKKSKFPSVTVYGTPTCAYCYKIKDHLKDNDVPFKYIDIAKDSSASEKLVKRSGKQGVPQTYIGSTHIMGFDKSKIDKLLGIN